MGKKDIERANRQCCDVLISDYATKKPFLFADFCNATGFDFSAENTYAMKKGQKAIAFSNPSQSSIKLECQVHPFKLYSLVSDGTIETEGVMGVKKTIKCTTAGELALTVNEKHTIQTGTVYVAPSGELGETTIEGSYSANKFTATSTDDIVVGKEYDVTYVVTKKDIKVVKLNDKKQPKNYFITMSTLDADEEGNQIPMKITVYKGAPKKSISLSFSSEGDPSTVSIEFDCLMDMDGNIVDIVEDDEE